MCNLNLHPETPSVDWNSLQRQFLSASDIARLFSVSLTTAYAWCRKQHVPAVKIGGCWYVPVAAIERMIPAGGDPVDDRSDECGADSPQGSTERSGYSGSPGSGGRR